MAPQRNMGISRTSSPAVAGGTNGRASEDEGVDMREIDGLLTETAYMLAKWAMYSRFLGGKCRVSPPQAVLLQAISKLSQDAEKLEEPLEVPDLLVKSALSRKIAGRLITPFNIMTTFYFRRSVEKAFQLDEPPTGLSLNPSKPIDGSPPYIISPVDDVMYIVKESISRSLLTSQRDVVAHAIPTIGRVLGSDFVGMIQRKMRDECYPKPVIQGGFPPEDKIISFILLINSLDTANDYVARIVSAHLAPPDPSHGSKAPPLHEMFPFDHDANFVVHALETLSVTFSHKALELVAEGLNAMFKEVVKLRLRPVLSETFRDLDYSLTEEDLAEIARENETDDDPEMLNDQVAKRFEHSWEALMKPIQRLMTPKCFTGLLDRTADHLADMLERRVWRFSGKMNALGAQRMERDFSGIIGVVARGGRYAVRDAFARVSQICMLVNMEEEEWDALVEEEKDGDEEMAWVLSEDERKRARGMVRG